MRMKNYWKDLFTFLSDTKNFRKKKYYNENKSVCLEGLFVETMNFIQRIDDFGKKLFSPFFDIIIVDVSLWK